MFSRIKTWLRNWLLEEVDVSPTIQIVHQDKVKLVTVTGRNGMYLRGFFVDGSGEVLVDRRQAFDAEHFDRLFQKYIKGAKIEWEL